MSQDELKKALQTARMAHERETELTYTITSLGALLRAVELLAERQDKRVTEPTDDEGIDWEDQATRNMRLVSEKDGFIEKYRVALSKALTGAEALPLGDALTVVADLRAKVDGLEKRIAEPAAPLTVDGKTPGQVAYEAFRDCVMSQHETGAEKKWEAALAVLRAFGQPSQTTQDAVEALRRVRERVLSVHRAIIMTAYKPSFGMSEALEIIDDEIAKLEAKPAPTSDHVHELGSCSFCDKRDNAKPTAAEISAAWYGHQSYMDSAAAERVRTLFDARPCFLCGHKPKERHPQSLPDTSTESGLPDVVLQEKSSAPDYGTGDGETYR